MNEDNFDNMSANQETVFFLMALLFCPVMIACSMADTLWNMFTIEDLKDKDLRYRLSEKVINALASVTKRFVK
jgi:hypothetical protein